MLIPTTAARCKLQQKLKGIFRRKRSRAVKEVIAEINPILRGWVNYFRIGNSSRHLNLIREWTMKKVRRHACRARNKPGFGWDKWSTQMIYQRTGLYNDYQIRHIK
jgi:RNA-directed DNA polymerase